MEATNSKRLKLNIMSGLDHETLDGCSSTGMYNYFTALPVR